ncbi:MAG: ABC transporter permease [Synergistaceae bacterium]|jgi:ABC-type dipeptide/oligopeptide/nickel transport system permease subunit|nr:ABC transporter permease [Synergistaceae bacterium]
MNAEETGSAGAGAGEGGTTAGLLAEMLRNSRLAAFSLAVIIFIIAASFAAPLYMPYDPNKPSLSERFAPPSASHWAGCDDLGRDQFTRLVYGARISIMIGLVPTSLSIILGTALGLVSGFAGGRTDFFIMRLADVVLAFPSLLLAMVVSYTLGGGVTSIFAALAFVGWAATARVIRAQTMSLKEKEFVESARSVGVRESVIMLRHILPNCIPNIIVLFTLNIPEAILNESALSFLGVGASPPSASWGLMVYRYKTYLMSYPWLAAAPGAAILIFVLAFNFLGDGVRDTLDPYMKD